MLMINNISVMIEYQKIHTFNLCFIGKGTCSPLVRQHASVPDFFCFAGIPAAGEDLRMPRSTAKDMMAFTCAK
jgi:hypothetical protein